MSPRNEEQNEQIKDERREQLLSAALKVFAAKGFAAAKISDIASRAGLSHGLVYHYFSSKEQIFLALLERALLTSAQSLLMVEQLPLSPVDKVRETAKYILGGIENYADSAYYFLIVMHASIMEGPGKKNGGILGKSLAAVESMVRILTEGQRSGEIREGNPYEMAMTFFAAIQGLALYKIAYGDFKMPDPEILVNIVKK